MPVNNETKQKIILALAAGVAMGFSRSPKNYFKILDSASRAWKDIDRKRLVRLVREFYDDKLVSYKEEKDGTIKIVLTKDGQQKALEYQFDNIKIKKPEKWDKKWRVVMFDIPEKQKKAREAIRGKLKELGFEELQKSVFVHPYECEDEIEFIVEVFKIRPYVRFLKADSFSNEEQFRLKFNI